MQKRPSYLGIFDSGVGGLSVLKAIRKRLPNQSILYFADQVHVPYGLRPLAEVKLFSEVISHFLKKEGAEVIVVACNTASAAALSHLRHVFPETNFVGMEPAVKPAAESTRTGVVGVLATPATFQGVLYASVVERFAKGVEILQDTCPGLVQQVEIGDLDSPKTRSILENALSPMLQRGIDTIVLGCTHYPFVIPLIEDIVGPGVRVIDPAPAVARQAERMIEALGNHENVEKTSIRKFLTSGSATKFAQVLPLFLGESGDVFHVTWESGKIMLPGRTITNG
jgi:glutamate racemase